MVLATRGGSSATRLERRDVRPARRDESLDALEQPSAEQRVWQVVSMIPPGSVATYGQVAVLAGMPRHARFVGLVLRRLPPGTRLPWHRVVNAALRISLRGGGEDEQKRRLLGEGVSFVGRQVARGCRWRAGLDCA